MKLQQLQIHQLPGLTQAVTLDDFASGVTFVSGPNASGKSSLIRALRFLLLPPHPEDPKALSLSAVFRDGSGRWDVQRNGSAITWNHDGEPTQAPNLPNSDRLGSYFITLEDLFLAENHDERVLAAALRRELHGGYDLARLRNQDFRLQTQVGIQQRIRLQRARQDLVRIERQYDRTIAEETHLPGLRDRIVLAGQRRAEADLLAHIQDWRSARRQHREIEARLAHYPADMGLLSGHESDWLRDLDSRLDALEAELARARTQEERAGARLRASGLTEACPTREALQLARDRIGELQRLEVQRTELDVGVAAQRAKIARLTTQLQIGETNGPDSLRLDFESLDRVERLALAIEPLRRQQLLLRQQLGAQDAAPVTEAMLDRQREIIRLLRDWLHQPGVDARRTRPLALAATASGILTLAGVGSTWAGFPAGMLLAGLGAALALVIATLWWLMLRRDGSGRTEPLVEALQAHGIDSPAAWTRPAVLEFLKEQEERLAEWRARFLRQREQARIAEDLRSVDAELEVLESERKELARLTGFDPLLPAFSLAVFLRHLQELRLAREELEKALALGDVIQGQWQATRAAVTGFLGTWEDRVPPWEEAIDAADMLQGLQHLQRRQEAATEARGEKDLAQQELRRIGREMRGVQLNVTRLLAAAGLAEEATSARRELGQRLTRLEDWRREQRNLRDAELRLQERGRQLPPDAAWQEIAQSAEDAEIEHRRLQALAEGEELESLQEEYTRIETQINQAGRDRHLESALAAVELANAEFADVRDGVLDSATAHFLLDEIEGEYRQEHEPQLLREARSLFREFTHHAWDLHLSPDEEGGFIAVETARDLPHPLRRLSTATRMQLLLAVRIARTLHEESGRTALPLFLDETLTTSDLLRATSMIEALQRLADDHDRQIVYLASSLQELELWERVTGRRPVHLDLGERRGRPLPRISLPLPTQAAIPEPGEMDAPAYARELRVPGIDPRGTAGGIHVFHLLSDDLQLLYRVLRQWRIETVGALIALLDHPDSAQALVPDPQARQNLRERCRLLGDWLELCQVGLGQPVDRGVLEQALAGKRGITQHTIDDVEALAMAHAHDAARLMSELERGGVRGFRSLQRERLREFLEEEGYLDPRMPVPLPQRRQRLLTRYHASLGIDAASRLLDGWENALEDPFHAASGTPSDSATDDDVPGASRAAQTAPDTGKGTAGTVEIGPNPE